MFKKKKVEKDIQENLRWLLKDLKMKRDLIIDKGRQALGILPTDFFYFVVEALLDMFPDMKKNKEIIGYYDRRKKFTEIFVLAFPESERDVTEEEYDIIFNKLKDDLLLITKEITEVKKELESGKWAK